MAGLGLRLVRLLEPVSVVRWVPWSAARLALPSGQALGKRLPTEQIVSLECVVFLGLGEFFFP